MFFVHDGFIYVLLTYSVQVLSLRYKDVIFAFCSFHFTPHSHIEAEVACSQTVGSKRELNLQTNDHSGTSCPSLAVGRVPPEVYSPWSLMRSQNNN